MPRPAEFSARTRQRSLEALAADKLDLLIIGGGITGAGIARDATLRGLRVGLLERRDFACGTSSRSSKLIHGGLRYLPQGDVALVMEAANERRAVRKIGPHLTRPQQMLVPVHSRSGYLTINAGLFTYDRMARVHKEERNRMLGREETLALEPLLRPERIHGAGLYFEYLTDDARLVIDTLKAAAALGALIVNRTAVTSFLHEGEKIKGVVARDETSGADLSIEARVIVNAAGPWVDAVRQLEDYGEKQRLHLTKGIHLILPRERLDLSRCVVMNAADKRSVFAIPRGDVVYLGTTDTDYQGRFDDPPITAEDAEYLLAAANATFAVEPLTFDDVAGAWAGLRPLLHQEGKKPSEISRKDEVILSSRGLISIAGGKLTTFRKMAERITDMVVERLTSEGAQLPDKRGDSESHPLSGGDIDGNITAYITHMKQRWPRVPADVVERLIAMYGSNGERMVEAMANDPKLGERCAPSSAVTYSEVAYAVREEMALSLEDFLERRARVFLWDRANGLDIAPAVARLMGGLLGWDAPRIDAEIQAYRQHVSEVKTFLPGDVPDSPPRAAYA
jgi:glycerol-3-phosphate dehydrogenase